MHNCFHSFSLALSPSLCLRSLASVAFVQSVSSSNILIFLANKNYRERHPICTRYWTKRVGLCSFALLACWLACLFACYLLFVRHIFICACDLVRCRVIFSPPSSFSIAGIFYVFTKLSIPSWALRDFVCLRSYAVKVFSKQKTKKNPAHTQFIMVSSIFSFLLMISIFIPSDSFAFVYSMRVRKFVVRACAQQTHHQCKLQIGLKYIHTRALN